MINHETNKFYETNGTATRITQLLQETKSVKEIIKMIYEEYEVD